MKKEYVLLYNDDIHGCWFKKFKTLADAETYRNNYPKLDTVDIVVNDIESFAGREIYREIDERTEQNMKLEKN